LTGSNYAIIGTATTFTVKVEVATVGTGFATYNSMQLSLDDFGTVSAAGSITAGDVDWEDGKVPATQIEWIDTVLTAIQGNTFVLQL